MYATPVREKIHYSVFADKYVLLQSEHSPPSHKKHVWFMRSGSMNEILKQKAQEIIKRSELISARIFKDFAASLSGRLAFHILYSLRDQPLIAEKIMSIRFWSQADIEDCLANLALIGFITISKDIYHITPLGLKYLMLFETSKPSIAADA